MDKTSSIAKKLILNVIASIILTFSIIQISPDKYLKTLSFEVLPETNPGKFLSTRTFPVQLKFFDYVKIIDREIREDKSINNLCVPIIEESGSLPVQFSYKNNFIIVKIISKSRDIIEKCSDQISVKLIAYNKLIQDDLLSKYEYESLILQKIKETKKIKEIENNLTDKTLNFFDEDNYDQLKSLRNQWMKHFNQTVREFNVNKDKLSEESVLKLEWLNSVMSLIMISNDDTRQKKDLLVPKIPENVFKSIVSELTMVKLSYEKIILINKPNFFLVFLSIFVTTFLLYIVFYKVFIMKKLNNILFKFLK